MTNEKSRGSIEFAGEEQRFLATFGDIRGFRSWVRRCGLSQFKRSYRLLQEQWQRFDERADLYKGLGDGFMAVWDLRSTHNCRLALDLIKLSFDTANEMELIRMGMPDPRFTGWRIRWVGGEALKWKQKVGRRTVEDYVGQRINLCKELLYVWPDEPIVLHESAWELFSPEQASKEGFILSSLPFRRHPELNVFDEDLKVCKRIVRKPQ